MDKALIIDTYAFLYRAFYASTGVMKNSNGVNIGAYSGFFSTILYLLKETKCTHIIFASDSAVPSKRKIQYSEYKSNRDHMPDDLRSQVVLVKSALQNANINLLIKDGLEADDIIVSVANECADKGMSVVIASGDKDILQAVDDKRNITLFRPPSFGTAWTVYDEKKIIEKYGVEKDSIASYLSLLGDASDNVPGVKGIGQKGAVELLKEYKTLDGVYNNLDKITKPKTKVALENGKDDAYLSYSLVLLKDNGECKIDNFEDYDINKINFSSLINTLERDGLHAVSSRFSKFLKESNIEFSKSSIPTEKNGSEEFKYSKKEVSVSDFENVINSNNALALYLNDDTNTLIYSTNDKDANLLKFNNNDIKIISKLITTFLSTKGNEMIGFDLKSIVKKFYNPNVSNIEATLFDIELMAYLTDSESQHFPKGLLSEKYIQKKFDDDVKKKQQTLFDTEVDGSFIGYAPLSFALREPIQKELEEKDLYNYYLTIEQKILPIIATLEKNGVYLDINELSKLKTVLTDRINEISEKIYTIIGHEINIASPQQVGTVLFDELKIAKGKKNKLGYSVDADVLESLRDVHPIVELILEYRSASKLRSTYTDSLISLVNPNDKRLHTTFLQTGTATGRFSSVQPNLQNIPVRDDEGRLVRMAFKSTEGNILLSADYSQIELVVLAHFSKDETLMSLFKSGEDVHRLTASLIFKKDKNDITPSERRVAKTINFGVIYGMSAFRLAGDLGIKMNEATAFLDEYFNNFSSVRKFIDDTIINVREKGFTTTLLGHKRYFPHINDSNKNIRSATERAAVNSIIQGSAADILKKAMIDITKEIQDDDVKLLLNVHDELIFELPENKVDSMKTKIERIMTSAVKLDVPLRVSIETAHSWGEMH